MPRAAVPASWPDLPDEDLLNLRLADLPITLAGTVIETRLHQLRAELAERGLQCPVHFYLAAEWFTPDGTVSMALPF